MFEGLLNTLRKKRDEVVQRVSPIRSPIPNYTPQRTPVMQQVKETVSKPFQYFNPESNGGNNFWSSPVANKLSQAQEFVESPKPFNIVPRIKVNEGRNIKQQVINEAVNLPGGMVNAFVNVPASIGSDMARIQFQKDKVTYDSLKSPFSRLINNALGVKRNPNEVIGNIAGVGSQIMDVYTPGVGKKIAVEGFEQGIKRIVPVVIKGAKEGALFNGIQSGLQGLSDNRNKGTATQVGEATKQAAIGAGIGAVTGGAVAGTGASVDALISKAAKRLMLNQPQLSETQAKKIIVDKYVRDFQGRFAKRGKAAIREFITDPSITPLQRSLLRRELGLATFENIDVRDQSGYIDFSEGNYNPKFVEPYARGDIKTLEKKMDELLGVDSALPYKKRYSAQINAMKELDYYAEQGDTTAQEVRTMVENIRNQMDLARTGKDKLDVAKNGKVIKITKSGVKIRQEPDELDQILGTETMQELKQEDQKALQDVFSQEQKGSRNAKEWEKQTGNVPSMKGAGKPPSEPPPDLLNPEEFDQEAGFAFEASDKNKGRFNEIFAKWIGKREAGGTTALQKAERFRSIPQDKAQSVIDAIEYPDEQVDANVKKYATQFKNEYDALFKEAKEAGVDIRYLKNYITHIWNKPVEEVKQMYKSLSTKFNFAKNREVPTYREGIKMGLVPKYTQPSQILAAYVDNLEKVKANLAFINELKQENFIVNAATARRFPGMFKPINALGFPQSRTFNADGATIGSYYAPSEIADTINRVFDEQNTGILDKTAKVSSAIQDISMSGGAPGTPLNAWTIAQITKEILSGRVISPIQAFFRSMSPKASDDYFRANLGQIKKMQEQNISVPTTVDIDSFLDRGLLKNTFGGSVGEAWNKFMNEPTFKRFMPMLQIQFFNDIEAQALRSGRSPEEAARIAGMAVKNFYGVTPSDTLAKRPKWKSDLATTVLFAPRYRESMINFWINNMKALRNPFALENRSNAAFMVGGLLTLIAMDQMNRATMGHSMAENGSGKEDKLLIPLEDGTVIGVPFMSSIATMPRLMFRVGNQARQGDFSGALREARGLLSSGVRPFADIAANENYFGQEITNENDTPEQRFTKQGQFLVEQYNHPYLKFFTGQGLVPGTEKKEPLYQSVAKAFELPIRFYTKESLERGRYFDARKEVLKGLTSQELKALDAIPKYENDPLNSMYKYQTFAKYPNVFKAQREIALKTAEKTGKPVDPLYLINDELARRYIAASMLPPGSSEKSDLYKAFPELGMFVEIRGKYFEENPIPGQENDSTRPVASEYVQAQMDNGNWKDPQVQEYLLAKDAWNNQQRDRLGLLPIDRENYGGFGGKKKTSADTIKVTTKLPSVSEEMRPIQIKPIAGTKKKDRAIRVPDIRKNIKVLQNISKSVRIK